MGDVNERKHHEQVPEGHCRVHSQSTSPVTIKIIAQTGGDLTPDLMQVFINSAAPTLFCICTFCVFLFFSCGSLISICWQSLRHGDWNMVTAFMLNLALHLVMRTDYSYKSIFKQIHTCKIFNVLNILAK